jgi:hypothetical protein
MRFLLAVLMCFWFMYIPLSGKAKTVDKILWYGIDFTMLSSVKKYSESDISAIVKSVIPSINQYITSRYVLKNKIFIDQEVDLNYQPVEYNNAAISNISFADKRSAVYVKIKSDIKSVIAKYEATDIAFTGCVVIPDTINPFLNNLIAHVVFFNTQDGSIIYLKTVRTSTRGYTYFDSVRDGLIRVVKQIPKIIAKSDVINAPGKVCIAAQVSTGSGNQISGGQMSYIADTIEPDPSTVDIYEYGLDLSLILPTGFSISFLYDFYNYVNYYNSRTKPNSLSYFSYYSLGGGVGYRFTFLRSNPVLKIHLPISVGLLYTTLKFHKEYMDLAGASFLNKYEAEGLGGYLKAYVYVSIKNIFLAGFGLKYNYLDPKFNDAILSRYSFDAHNLMFFLTLGVQLRL